VPHTFQQKRAGVSPLLNSVTLFCDVNVMYVAPSDASDVSRCTSEDTAAPLRPTVLINSPPLPHVTRSWPS
jgi:hypothetical protein